MSGDMNFSMQQRSNNSNHFLNNCDARFLMNSSTMQQNRSTHDAPPPRNLPNATGPIISTSAAVSAHSVTTGSARNDRHDRYSEEELWNYRIIVSALEEIAFASPASPKIPPQLLQSLQTTLINLRSEFRRSPFVKSSDGLRMTQFENNQLSSIETAEIGQLELNYLSQSQSQNDSYRKTEPMMLMSCIPSEARLVIRTLVSIHIRNLAKGIIEMFKPITSTQTTEVGGEDQSETVDENNQILRELGKINSLLETMKADSHNLDKEILELKKERELEVQAYDQNVTEVEKLVTQLVQLFLQEKQSEKVLGYLDYLKRETENIALKTKVAELVEEIESNPTELVDEIEEQFNKLKVATEQLEAENEAIQKRLSDYKALGQDYTDLLEEYKMTEEEIKTKEWVKEQLANTQGEKSLSESFF